MRWGVLQAQVLEGTRSAAGGERWCKANLDTVLQWYVMKYLLDTFLFKVIDSVTMKLYFLGNGLSYLITSLLCCGNYSAHVGMPIQEIGQHFLTL